MAAGVTTAIGGRRDGFENVSDDLNLAQHYDDIARTVRMADKETKIEFRLLGKFIRLLRHFAPYESIVELSKLHVIFDASNTRLVASLKALGASLSDLPDNYEELKKFSVY